MFKSIIAFKLLSRNLLLYLISGLIVIGNGASVFPTLDYIIDNK